MMFHADFMAQSGLPMKAGIDEKIHKVLACQDLKERSDLYREILATLHEQAVYLPLFYSALFEVHRPDRLGNVSFGGGKTDIPFREFVLE